MQNAPRITELVQRERFIKRVIGNASLYFVAGDDGWACVPFRHDTARDVVLFWSTRADAARWSDVVADNPQIHQIDLATLLASVLPMLKARGCLIGPDWSTDPADPVLDAADLSERLWREMSDSFLVKARAADSVWLLESASGPAFLPSTRMAGKEFLPVWSSREAATANAAGSWAVKRPISVSLAVFADRYLPFLEQRGWFVASEPIPGCGARELTPAEFTLRAFPAQTLAALRAV
jgi:Protein of unknown function (DUF2750)